MESVNPGWEFSNNKMVYNEPNESQINEKPDKRTFRILNEIANSVEKGIKLTHDVPSCHENGMMPVLDIQTWVDKDHFNIQQIHHTFYKKEVASIYTILSRSAISNQTKRATNLQEGLRRLQNVSPNLPWAEKAKVLSSFSNMLYISGYSEKYRFNIIKGAILRHKEIIKKSKRKRI